jgi:anti-sigma factor RsiW
MTNRLCDALGPLLVEYADGESSAADSARVERHLAECGACRTEIAALRRSIGALESVWSKVGCTSAGCSPNRSARHTSSIPTDRENRPSTRFQASLGGSEAYRLAAALGSVAAAIGLAFGVYRAQRPVDDPQRAMAISSEGTTSNAQVAAGDAAIGMDDFDIDTLIQRQEQSARLAASVRFLTSMPVDREDADRAQRYLRNAYGVDQAGSTNGEAGDL